MNPHLFFYQPELFGLLRLFITLHYPWPDEVWRVSRLYRYDRDCAQISPTTMALFDLRSLGNCLRLTTAWNCEPSITWTALPEFACTAVLTFCAFRRLGSYGLIGLRSILHTVWDVVHHLYGNPIGPFLQSS
jgi:Family of unknown function (DUF6010)